MAVRDEMERLLRDAPYGGVSALARRMGVSPASVSAWKSGVSVPDSDRWPVIEEFLGLPSGHLRRVAEGRGETDVEPGWPTIRGRNNGRRANRRDDDLDRLREQIADLASQLAGLNGTVADLADEVGRLRGRLPQAGGESQ